MHGAFCNIGWNYYGVTNRAAVQLRNPHQLGRFVQLTGLSKTCNQGLEDLSGGIQSIRYFQHLLGFYSKSCTRGAALLIRLDVAGTMDIFDVCTGWLFALPKEASVMMPFSRAEFFLNLVAVLYHFYGDEFFTISDIPTGSNQLLYIHSLMSNFPTTVELLPYLD